MKILVAEDDPSLRAVLEKRLKANGFAVLAVNDGLMAINALKMESYDLVISDVMMPEMNGMELLKAIRARKIDVPVLFLTAKDGTNDIISGLDAGADDYMVKPFEFGELLARIRLLTRRRYGSRDNTYEVSDLVVNADQRTVTRGDKEIKLSFKEFELLQLLVKNKNKVLSRDQIANCIYEMGDMVESNAIDVYIRYLRKKVDDDFDNKIIHTVRGVGYVVKD